MGALDPTDHEKIFVWLGIFYHFMQLKARKCYAQFINKSIVGAKRGLLM